VAFAIKAAIRDPRMKTFAFVAQKTMYGGKRITKGDTVFVFASENEGRTGLDSSGRRHLRPGASQEARNRPANATREHHCQTHRPREATARA
jgi:hypothetical protein